jgi:hypothetical protein
MFAGLAAADERRGTLRMVDSSSQIGRIVSVDRDWDLQFDTDQGVRTIAATQMVSFGQHEPMPLRPFVVLADLSVIVLRRSADFQHLQNDRLTINSEWWDRFSLPIDTVLAIVLRPLSNELQRDQWIFAAPPVHDLDVIELVNGDTFQGHVLDTSGDTCRFEWNSGVREIPLAQVAAIRFNPRFASRPKPRDPHAIVGLRDGSRVTVQTMTLDGDQLALELPSGVTLRTSPVIRPAQDKIVCSIRPMHAGIRYLSDQMPTSHTQLPYLDLPWHYGLNQSLAQGQLAHQGVPADKGIALHATARIEFPIEEGFHRFDADLCLDDSGHGIGSVVFRVFLFRKGTWRESFVSREIRGADRQSCSLDVTGANRISLVVDHADRADIGDHADWLDARLVR